MKKGREGPVSTAVLRDGLATAGGARPYAYELHSNKVAHFKCLRPFHCALLYAARKARSSIFKLPTGFSFLSHVSDRERAFSMPNDPDLVPFDPPPRPLRLAEGLRTFMRNHVESYPLSTYEQLSTRINGPISDTLFVCDPALIQELLVTRSDEFGRDAMTKAAFEPIISPTSLFLAEGTEWRWQRRFRYEADAVVRASFVRLGGTADGTLAPGGPRGANRRRRRHDAHDVRRDQRNPVREFVRNRCETVHRCTHGLVRGGEIAPERIRGSRICRSAPARGSASVRALR
jgi:hypothetical protein